MKTIGYILIAFSCLCTISPGQEVSVNYSPGQYPHEEFETIDTTYSFHNARIRIIHVRRIAGIPENPAVCRAWLLVSRDGKTTFERCFADLDAVGGPAGLFVPEKELNQIFFPVIKLGDYDGELFLVDSTGEARIYLGGAYIVSDDRMLLLSEYFSDLPGIEIVDLTTGQSLFTDIRGMYGEGRWVSVDNSFAFLPEDNPDSVFVYRPAENDFASMRFTKELRARAIYEPEEFSLDWDCHCGPSRRRPTR